MSGRLLSNEERMAWLRLIRSETIGPVTFGELLDHFGTAEAALDAVPPWPSAAAGASAS